MGKPGSGTLATRQMKIVTSCLPTAGPVGWAGNTDKRSQTHIFEALVTGGIIPKCTSASLFQSLPLAQIWCQHISSPLKSPEWHISRNATQQTHVEGHCGPEPRPRCKDTVRPVSSSHVLDWDGGSRCAHPLPSGQAEGGQGHESDCQSTEEGVPASVPRRHGAQHLGTRSCRLRQSSLCLTLAVRVTQPSLCLWVIM